MILVKKIVADEAVFNMIELTLREKQMSFQNAAKENQTKRLKAIGKKDIQLSEIALPKSFEEKWLKRAEEIKRVREQLAKQC